MEGIPRELSTNGQTRTWLNNFKKLWSVELPIKTGILNLLLNIFGCTLIRNMFMTTLSKLSRGKGKRKTKRPAFPNPIHAFCFLNQKTRQTHVQQECPRSQKQNYEETLHICFRRTGTKKKKKNNFTSIDKASLTVHPCAHYD